MAQLTVRKIGRKVIGANEERETPPAEAMLPGGPYDL